MKVIQVPFTFYPDPCGGTEVYVEALARSLSRRGVETLIAAPSDTEREYWHHGLRVFRFAVAPIIRDLSDLYNEGDLRAAESFEQIIEKQRPDLVHLHAFTPSVSLRLLRRIKKRKIPAVFTYHTPTVSCQRGTLMRWGNTECDGRLLAGRCASCTLNGLGIPRGAADLVGHVPQVVGRQLGRAGLQGGIWTALRMSQLVSERHTAIRALMQEVDCVVAVCEWVRELLLNNNVPAGKLILSRQGLSAETVPQLSVTSPDFFQEEPLRLAFIGRLHPTKGLHLLVEAMRMAPTLPIRLDVYGVTQNGDKDPYVKQLHADAARDNRIQFQAPLANDQIVEYLRRYHLLAVPSQWLETGPLVILEAFAAQIPVLGSRRGGIMELVKHGENGLLVEPESPAGWRQALEKICSDRSLLQRLRAGIVYPRAMSTVAEEMDALYKKVLVSQ